jgi:single-stranded DNA-binding protein
MQKVVLIGYLGRDPEVRYSAQGTVIALSPLPAQNDGGTKAANRRNTQSGSR